MPHPFARTLWKSCAHGTLFPENRASVGHAGRPPSLLPSPGKPHPSAVLYILLSGAFVRLVLSTLAVYRLQLGPRIQITGLKQVRVLKVRCRLSKATADPVGA